MKYRNKKAIATLIVTTLIFTCGATGVQAAPATDLNIVGNVVAAPIPVYPWQWHRQMHRQQQSRLHWYRIWGSLRLIII